MTHLINEKCINCKFTNCVEVCPVDCFHEGINFLVINPKICIDCGICITECPIKAINNEYSNNNLFKIINFKFSKIWPNINKIKKNNKNKWLNIKNKLHNLNINL